MTIDFLWEVFVTLFIIIDPFATAPLFMSLTKDYTKAVRNRIARKACFISITLLILFGIVGKQLFELIRVSNSSFRIAGGFLLLLAAIDMVMAKPSSLQGPTKDEALGISHQDDIAVFPLSIPMIAGPGALTTMVFVMQRASPHGNLVKIAVLGCAALVVLITYLIMRASEPIIKHIGVTGVNVLARVMGIVLAALAIENIVQGIFGCLVTFKDL